MLAGYFEKLLEQCSGFVWVGLYMCVCGGGLKDEIPAHRGRGRRELRVLEMYGVDPRVWRTAATVLLRRPGVLLTPCPGSLSRPVTALMQPAPSICKERRLPFILVRIHTYSINV